MVPNQVLADTAIWIELLNTMREARSADAILDSSPHKALIRVICTTL